MYKIVERTRLHCSPIAGYEPMCMFGVSTSKAQLSCCTALSQVRIQWMLHSQHYFRVADGQLHLKRLDVQAGDAGNS